MYIKSKGTLHKLSTSMGGTDMVECLEAIVYPGIAYHENDFVGKIQIGA